jgi:hypothetical protein
MPLVHTTSFTVGINEEDNSSDKLYKGDVEIEFLDNRLSNIESGENLVKCNEPEPVDMQEVNELMNENGYDICSCPV